MPRRSSISVRRLTLASEQAGANASPEEIAKHYLAPVLSRYFESIPDARFLNELTENAQYRADKLTGSTEMPTVSERVWVGELYLRMRRWELACGWAAVIAMSLAFGLLTTKDGKSLGWIGFLAPFFGPGYPVYLIVSSFVVGLMKLGGGYQKGADIAAKVLAAERSKTAYWRSLHWRDLEYRVAALFRAKGYNAQVTPASGDKGVDVVAQSGHEKIVIQCKQYSKPAQRNIVSELLGVMTAERATQAILICTGGFTKGTEVYARENGVILWDSEDLARENINPDH